MLRVLLATLALAGGVAACGGDGGGEAPTGVSESRFCEAYNSLFAEGGLEDATDAEIIEEIRAWGRRMHETGTPDSMPAEARAGFEETVDQLQSLDEDDGRRQLERLEEDASEESRRRMAAFDEFSMQACGPPMGEEPPPAPR